MANTRTRARQPVEKTEVVYHVAISLDGFIADGSGGVQWLHDAMVPGEGYGLEAFHQSIDAVLMGSRTYEAALAMRGGFGTSTPCWVFSRRALPGTGVTVTSATPAEIVRSLPQRGIRRAWLMGGGKLASSFLAAGLIDEISLGVMPVVLGSGIPLFDGGIAPTHLRLTEKREFKGGALGLVYRPT